ncbi:MAG: peptidylprolyl isomerase [Cellvibrionaceae bacterium]|nr:peptidylprolyl isomerase [Cellvibrionaceae bacterium]
MKFRNLIAAICCCVGSASAQSEAQLASAKGVEVSLADVSYFIGQAVPKDQRGELLKNKEALVKIAQEILVGRILANEAKANDSIDVELIEWIGQYQIDEQLKGRQLQFEAEKNIENVKLDKAAKDIYDKDKKPFTMPVEVNASHILISSLSRSQAEAKTKAEALLKRIKAGEKFEDLIPESEDPSAKQNKGNLGFFGPGQMVPEFEKAAYALKEKGDMSDLVRTPYGYHIIKLIDRKEGKVKAFEEVKPQLIAELKRSLLVRYKMDRQQSLLKGIEVNLDDKSLSALQSKFKPAGN